jgi:hypothetical protein
MGKCTFIRRLDWLSSLVIITVALIFAPRALTRESVRAELIRLQNQYGLTVAWVDGNVETRSVRVGAGLDSGVRAVSFAERRVITLKDSLQAFRPEGFRFENIPRVATVDLCWSHDKSRLAATMLHPPEASLGIYDLGSKVTQVIELRAEQRMHFTSQCWSRDDKQVAYESEGSVKVSQVGGDTLRVRVLARGTDVTWSPDGEWIAFRDRDTYYAIHPDGNGRKKLFHNHWGGAVSALYWSPDSRIVAYVRELGFLQGGALDAEVNQLRVRRLEDGSEDRLCPDSVDWYANYHWIMSRELLKSPASDAPH